jgi:chitodextrinase
VRRPKQNKTTMKLSIITLSILLSFSAYSTPKNVSYVKGQIYELDGAKYKFIGYDDNNNAQFQGFTVKYPDYHGAKKNIIKANKKAIQSMIKSQRR